MAWVFDDRDLAAYDGLFLVIGRALHLATEFEHKCRCVLSMLRAVHHIAQSDDVDAALEFARAVERRLLHPMIQELGQRGVSDPEDVALLERARLARNFVAHEAANLSMHRPADLLARIRAETCALAAGDNVVLRWWYEMTEKRRAPHDVQKSYVDQVERWVFGGILPA